MPGAPTSPSAHTLWLPLRRTNFGRASCITTGRNRRFTLATFGLLVRAFDPIAQRYCCSTESILGPNAIALVVGLPVITSALIGASFLGLAGTEWKGALDFSVIELIEIDQILVVYK
jgi:hypothetical protein